MSPRLPPTAPSPIPFPICIAPPPSHPRPRASTRRHDGGAWLPQASPDFLASRTAPAPLRARRVPLRQRPHQGHRRLPSRRPHLHRTPVRVWRAPARDDPSAAAAAAHHRVGSLPRTVSRFQAAAGHSQASAGRGPSGFRHCIGALMQDPLICKACTPAH